MKLWSFDDVHHTIITCIILSLSVSLSLYTNIYIYYIILYYIILYYIILYYIILYYIILYYIILYYICYYYFYILYYFIIIIISFSAGRALFAHMPKGHAMAHVFYSLKVSAVHHHVSFSPLTVSVQADEDYIGKVSRLSRRTNATQAIKRVIERSLMASYKHWRSLGFLKE